MKLKVELLQRIYLDHNASTPLRKEAKDAMLAVIDDFGNPSSIHLEGRKAKGIVERARAQVAQALGASTVSYTHLTLPTNREV